MNKKKLKNCIAWAVLNGGKIDTHFIFRTRKKAKLNSFDCPILKVKITPHAPTKNIH